MFDVISRWSLGLATIALLVAGCPEDGGGGDSGGDDVGYADDTSDMDPDGDDSPDGDDGPDGGDQMDGGDALPDADGGGAEGTEFQITVTNLSGGTHFPTPFGPFAWAVHSGANPLYETGTNAGDGLEALAEDGDPSTLVSELEQISEVENAGALGSSPLTPDSNSLQGTFRTTESAGTFSFASMLVQSNDLFVSPGSDGLALFDSNGEPTSNSMVVSQSILLDAGSERNQAPAMGPVQAPRQSGSDTGAAEGIVAPYQDSTRALPQPADFVDVSVSASGGSLTVTVEALESDVIATPLGGVYYASHNKDFSFFDPTGGNSATSGLETLAEDGTPGALVTETSGGSNVKNVDSAVPNNPPLSPGSSVEFEVTPDSDHKYMSFASMVVETNDAFIAPTGDGIQIADESGELRETSAIEAELRRKLAVWDAGTEENEVPGIGPAQAPRQASNNTGPDDGNSNVRLYRDATNDLRGDAIGNQYDVSVSKDSGTFEITVENIDPDNNPFPFHLTPFAIVVHSDAVQPFESSVEASSGLEAIAEDGAAADYLNSLPSTGGNSDLKSKFAVTSPEGVSGDEPIAPGEAYSFSVEPDSSRNYLSILSMIIPSNDAFLSTGTTGVKLMDADGNLRNEGDVEGDLEDALAAWDAGTEVNQPGAAGPDQATGPDLPGGQSAAGEGSEEGNGEIREYNGLYAYPMLGDILEITIEPTDN